MNDAVQLKQEQKKKLNPSSRKEYEKSVIKVEILQVQQ